MILFWIATSGFALLATDEQMLLESAILNGRLFFDFLVSLESSF